MNKLDSYACKRLSEQIKFFGARPKRFVSIYAKKPRIRVKNKSRSIIPGQSFDISDEQKCLVREGREALMRNMAARGGSGGLGVAGSFLSGMAMGQAAQQAAMSQQLGAQKAFQEQRNMFLQQQPNAYLANLGRPVLNSLTGGFY